MLRRPLDPVFDVIRYHMKADEPSACLDIRIIGRSLKAFARRKQEYCLVIDQQIFTRELILQDAS
ncbi:MAG TPA: hypothetical protein VGE48_01860 [Candidatus Paceibacterota bacterium]